MLSWSVRDVANYASCKSAISPPIHSQIQINFLYRNYQTNFIYILKLYTVHMRFCRGNAVIHRSFLVWKNACLNYREFDHEGDLVGAPCTWNLSGQSFITGLKLVWRKLDLVVCVIEKGNVSFCRGHELANTLYIGIQQPQVYTTT